jgi:hypothetical protein
MDWHIANKKRNYIPVGKEHQADAIGGDELQHLKRVSRIKHVILEKYFPSWAMILGSRNCELAYVDCFAGPGQYEMAGKAVEGSPVIAVCSQGARWRSESLSQDPAGYRTLRF